MKNSERTTKMNSKTAIKIMLCLVVAILLFHLNIVLKIVPYEITWGGRLTTDSEMYVFEIISILLNLILGLALLIKGNYIKHIVPVKIVTVTLWIFLILFGLNTIGNVFAKTNFEKLFTVLTLSMCILLWIILKGKRINDD